MSQIKKFTSKSSTATTKIMSSLTESAPARGLAGRPSKDDSDRAPKVHSSLELTDKTINSLHSLLGELESRLRCVSGQEPTDNCKEAMPPMPKDPPIYDRIAQQERDVQNAVNRVQEMIRLLEI